MSSFTPLVLPCPVQPAPARSILPAPRAGQVGGTHWEVRGKGKERPLEDTVLEAVGSALRERDQVALAMQVGWPKLLPHTRHTAEGEDVGRAVSGQVGPWPVWRQSWMGGGERRQVDSAGKDVAGWCPAVGG